jgi:hypothetical protein
MKLRNFGFYYKNISRWAVLWMSKKRGEYWASHPCRFSPGEGAWIPQPIWTFWRRINFFLQLAFEPCLSCRPARGAVAVPSVLSRPWYCKKILLFTCCLLYSCYGPGHCSTFGTDDKRRTNFMTEKLSLCGRTGPRLQQNAVKMWTGISWLSEVYCRVLVNMVMNCWIT